MAEYYWAIRSVHVWSVTISLSLFALRGASMLAGRQLHLRAPLRIVPHAVDTVLLTSALMLTTIVNQYPFVHAWLTGKVIALVAYVVLGSVALRRGMTRRARVLALPGAIASAAYIVATALHRDPNPLRWLP